ncbi:hypothetical protein SDRG_06429 [Saprolegnia diclina VS20]|uniref:Uncharacterized protein n=1 Tax=Saprolegnia diclina (strain VS20) TaxID=1156394 RepID=T0QEI3_SAPDV|nr:hypothetical protein SDRG_06429 [Saprolegnia diclina VS20]EQC36324.1 hypothetical protein SDRG_06429 [Saprolegnia diclina VS20]|eukprot:XP_008610430.1 hypothetical protein SDRG_06429 [Saprolegnia diclina VS20]
MNTSTTCTTKKTVISTVISTAFARQVHESKVGGASFAQIASLQKATLVEHYSHAQLCYLLHHQWLKSPGLFPNSNPIVAFPSFGHCSRFPLIGPGLVRDINCGEMRRLEALLQAAMAATTATHLCGAAGASAQGRSNLFQTNLAPFQ